MKGEYQKTEKLTRANFEKILRNNPMIKYLGSKKKILEKIVPLIKDQKVELVLDLFSGTSRVGHALQNEGIKVISNDITTYGYFLATTYVQADPLNYSNIRNNLDDLKDLTPQEVPGWFSTNYNVNSQFFQIENSLKIETMRNYIRDRYGDNSELSKILVVSLMEAADRVDSTCGLQMAHLKWWAPRSFNSLQLRIPNFSKGKGQALQRDAMEVANLDVELVYMDPPYNQHNYLANYHIWETLCKWDNPSTYGVVQKRADVKERKSKWNSKRECGQEFSNLISKITAPKILLSFNDEGYLTSEFIVDVLTKNSFKVDRVDIPYKRYVGSQIGIYNKKSQKVGTVKTTKNKEHLFLGIR